MILHLCCYSLTAQVNYVLNPSLEQYSRCPIAGAQIMFALHWSSIDTNWYIIDTLGNPDCSSSYCNTCDTFSSSLIAFPVNPWFSHSYPRSGNGMAEVLMFVDSSLPAGSYERDYLQGRLYQPLIPGHSYCVTFYVMQNQGGAAYAINHIGAYLDKGQIDTALSTCGSVQTQYTPQVVENSIINDTLNWTKVEGSFIANGTERFITIGNFYDLTNTAHFVSNTHALGGGSYYLVDDVSVIETGTPAFAWGTDTLHKGYLDSFLLGRNETIPDIKWFRDGVLIDTLNAGIWIKDDTVGSYHTYIVEQILCGITTWDTVVVSVQLVNVSNVQNGIRDFRMYPNPNNGSFNIKTPRFDSRYVTIEVLNMMGQLVYSETVTVKNNSLDKQVNLKVPPGVYMLRVMGDSGSSTIQRVAVQ